MKKVICGFIYSTFYFNGKEKETNMFFIARRSLAVHRTFWELGRNRSLAEICTFIFYTYTGMSYEKE